MRVICISLLLLSVALTLLSGNEAGQAEQLKRLIQSTKPSSSFSRSAPWFDAGAAMAAASPSLSPVYTYPQEGLMAGDKIAALPGQPEGVDFDQYAGYVTVNGQTGRALFYYFVESPSNSSTNPLVLWLNGGPGCSSLGYGAMEELGPFRVMSDGKTLQLNPYSWNNVANVIFLESPAGVGFSYSNTTSDYDESGDTRTAEDGYTFLVNWLERFPQYKGRDFYITGESYGGHYVPQLAALILQRNKARNNTHPINLQAIAIGNAYVDDATNDEGTDEFLTSHAIISPDGSSDTGNIDPYNIYAPVCVGSNSTSKSGVAMADVDPCKDDYVHAYLNIPDVQSAMHARSTDWEACIILPWNDRPASTIPVIEQLVGGGLIRVWLYSGDTDSVCPYQGTIKAIKLMKLSITDSWRPWYSQQQVGGYVTGYGQLTLVTVRGAGHLVPTYQPERALTMLSAFLDGVLPPP